MSNRLLLKQKFLDHAKLTEAICAKTMCDASIRKYERLVYKEKSYILMDVDSDDSILEPFVKIGNFLLDTNLSAPKIIATDYENGFLLLEDFGDNSYNNLLDKEKDKEHLLYKYAIDVIINLQQTNLPEGLLPLYDHETLLEEVKLFTSWYVPLLNGEKLPEKLQEEYNEIWSHLLTYTQSLSSTIVLRDYHADNLMWLPERVNIMKVGLLDFQDAVIGSPVYDIVSLLEDARRDVSEELIQDMISYYTECKPNITRKEFLAHYTILGVQRNLKIMGIFARKAMRDQNDTYLKFIPRVRGYISNSIKHPLLLPIRQWCEKVLPMQIFNVTNPPPTFGKNG